MEFKDLTPGQQAKAKACKTPEEMIALAKAEGYELSDEELQAVTGGADWGIVGEILDHDCRVDLE